MSRAAAIFAVLVFCAVAWLVAASFLIAACRACA